MWLKIGSGDDQFLSNGIHNHNFIIGNFIYKKKKSMKENNKHLLYF